MARQQSSFGTDKNTIISTEQWQLMEDRWAEISKHVEVTNHEMGAVQKDVAHLKQDVSGVQAALNALDKSVAVLNNDVGTVKADVAAVKKVIDEFRTYMLGTSATIIIGIIAFIITQFYFQTHI